ncbi:MAG TPA: zinc-ribbon domain-containing protein [Euryarchaeota archaeon]|nr:TM2 domain protein [archaeon BMS3Bbin15]HDL15129.1 zinc-ribbon domain-containing protein [Euryarchaeota archaeon]
MAEQLKGEKYCVNCGEKIDEKAEICPKCGVRQSVPGSKKKDSSVAAILSFFFTGLGQIYNGQRVKGILLIFIQVINIFLMGILIGFITFPFVWIWGMYDAYKTAERINEGHV